MTQDPTKQLLRLELAELYLELQKYEQAERELQHLISGEAGGGEAGGGGGDARGALKRWKSAGSAAMIEAAANGAIRINAQYNAESAQFSTEEILGMILQYLRSLVSGATSTECRDVVLCVPGFFTDVRRRCHESTCRRHTHTHAHTTSHSHTKSHAHTPSHAHTHGLRSEDRTWSC